MSTSACGAKGKGKARPKHTLVVAATLDRIRESSLFILIRTAIRILVN